MVATLKKNHSSVEWKKIKKLGRKGFERIEPIPHINPKKT